MIDAANGAARDHFAEFLSPLHASPLFLTEDPCWAGTPVFGAVVLVDRRGDLPDTSLAAFDACITTAREAPAPWVSIAPGSVDAALDRVESAARRAPVATGVLARLLRLGNSASFEAALELESLAYSNLPAGAEFQSWLAQRKPCREVAATKPQVRYERTLDCVTLTLASPRNRNAMTSFMRDALIEALANVLDDPSEPTVVLRGAGKCFSTGGDLAEFGLAKDPARAHVIRIQRSAARMLHLIGDRATSSVHGACNGSGIEIAAAAHRRIAAADTFIQLPELAMGLIPGAGGTVTITRAIGHHRMFWLALTGKRLRAEVARGWGVFHEVTA